MLIAGLLGTAAAWLTAQLLNRVRLSRFLAYPPLVLLALAVLYTVLLGTFVIPA
jgi:type II secretory pathway component PulF